MNDMDQRCVVVFDQEGVLFLKIDLMLYGFYYLDFLSISIGSDGFDHHLSAAGPLEGRANRVAHLGYSATRS